VKLENILIMASGGFKRVVLSDFGLAVSHIGTRSGGVSGSPFYLAPELINATSSGYTEKVDIWATAITMFACLTRRMPFSTNNQWAANCEILRGLPGIMDGEDLGHISDEAKDLMRKMLAVRGSERISAEDALHHEWFRPIWDEIEGKTIGSGEEVSKVEQDFVANRY
jgi:serine/threonine protein kinase